ncbi:MAG: phosphoribosylglycinamide formyltransferase, partial [Firmicutes bacterium]|nr:phosphoribosylglycinamide formyltransferase [Bacillota bacterium]
SGGGTNLQALIDAQKRGIIESGEIVLVVSNSAGAYALERAANHGIDGTVIRKKDYETEDAFYDALIGYLESFDVDLVILAGYMTVLGSKFIKRYENKIINIHPALIPSFCGDGFYGLKVHEAALEKGVKITGATVHFVNEETDAGPIIIQKAVEVLDGDTPEVLQKRVMEQAEWKIFPEAVKLISEGKIVVENGKVRRLD